jgi:hypothetical protein
MKNRIGLVFLLAFWVCLFENAFCASPWHEFLMSPDKHGFASLGKSIGERASHCNWGNASNKSVAPLPEEQTRLFSLMEKGNEWAFRAALMACKCWDGGDLEDFYRSGGIFFEIQPRTFLRAVKEQALPDQELGDLLTMLPLNTVDNVELQISTVRKRIKIMKSINDDTLQETKKRGLSFLKEGWEDLNRHREASGNGVGK